MAIHAISYDLSKPGRDYDTLFKVIKSLGSWCHPLESLWIVRTGQTAAEIRDQIKAVIDSNDSVLVTELTGSWASYIGVNENACLRKVIG